MIYGPLSEVLLDGRYRVGEVVGTGGFGTVYAAIHVGLAGKVAIKVPRIDDLAPSSIPGAIATFLDEGRTLKRLRHPGLVAALDVALLPPDEAGLALPYLVLEWCDGPTLKDWMASRPGPMSAREAWSLLRPAFEALAHAHAEGVAHRDIKPRNILVETSREGAPVPRVIDFGIAKILGGEAGSSGVTRTTSIERAFTPRYAAPEQLTGMRSGTSTDVFALALVLLEVVRGEPVFATDDDARTAVIEAGLPTPRRLGLDLDRWNDPIERALAAKPADRHPDAGAFMRALDEALAGAPRGPSASPALFVPRLATPAPAPRPGPGSGSADDDSVVPSSHTLRTFGAPRAVALPKKARLPISAIVGGVSLLVVLLVPILMFGGLDVTRGWTTRRPAGTAPGDVAPAASAEPAPTASTDARHAMRPLRDLSPKELAERAAAAGLTDCKVITAAPEMVDVACASGRLALMDFGPPSASHRVWSQTLRTAKPQAENGSGVRYTIDDTIGLVVVAPMPIVEGVTARVLDGLRHEPVREPPPLPPPAKIPERLADWKGPEVATRIRAMGGLVQEEMSVFGVTSVLYRLRGKDGLVVHEEIDPNKGDAFLASATPPDAFAVDGGIALRVKGDDELSKLPHLKLILGTTTATRTAERR